MLQNYKTNKYKTIIQKKKQLKIYEKTSFLKVIIITKLIRNGESVKQIKQFLAKTKAKLCVK